MSTKSPGEKLHEQIIAMGITWTFPFVSLNEMARNAWEAAAQAVMPKWIPVTERLPEHHKPVLVTLGEWDVPRVVCAIYFEYTDKKGVTRSVWHQTSEFIGVDGDACLDYDPLEVTHWMSMPLPPVTAQEGEGK